MEDHLTTEKLAMLAATLARNTNDKPDSLIRSAYLLWWEAKRFLNPPDEHDEINAIAWAEDAAKEDAKEAAQAAAEEALPKPKDYPVTLDQFLRLLLPKLIGRTADQFATFRAYLRTIEAVRRSAVASANGEFTGKLQAEAFAPTKEEVDAMIADRRAKPLQSLSAYRHEALRFQEWHLTEKTKQVSEARRAAALKRHTQPQKRKASPPREKLKESLLT